jgi:2-oxoacid:acceptor oxidoreductase delta subunit (pyruvate/2-ketoisovalerate family)
MNKRQCNQQETDVKKAVRGIAKKYGIGTKLCEAACEGSVWREKKPVWNRTGCFKCAACYLSCPDASIMQVDDGYYDMHQDICKGCGICARECPNDAITMTPDVK